MPSAPDCLTCGACCASPFEGGGYIRLDREEEVRLGRLGLPVFEIISDPEDRLAMLGTRRNGEDVCVCIALTGTVGRRVSCSIYEARPALCRQFEAGSPECHDARRAFGMTTNVLADASG
jgi:Fe-S-cluster containining protein